MRTTAVAVSRLSVRLRQWSIATALALLITLLPMPVASAAPVPGTYVAVTPTRLLDTRNGTGAPRAKLGAGQTLTLQVGGRGGVPASGVSAVALNVNAVNPTAAGRIIAYATGTTRPNMSSVNFVAGRSGTALVMSRVSGTGRVSLHNTSSQPVDLIADLSGYVVGGTVTAAGGLVTVPPSRSLDTRSGVGGVTRADLFGDPPHFGPVTFSWPVAGRNGVPANARAAVLAITITNVASSDTLAPYPDGQFNPARWDGDSPINQYLNGTAFTTGVPTTNLYIVPIGANGRVGMSSLFNVDGTYDVLADVLGYVRGGLATTPGTFQTVPSTPLTETTIPAGASHQLRVPGDPRAVAILTLTVRAGGSSGALVLYEPGTARPSTRNVNFAANQVVSNSAIVRSSASGFVTVTNTSASPVVVKSDASGFFRGAAPVAGTLWSWGDNFFGTLAAGWDSEGSEIVAPTRFTAVRRVYSGDGPAQYAIRTDGSLWAWGSWRDRSFTDDQGNPLGLGSVSNTATPRRVPGVANVTDVNKSRAGVLILQADGTVWGSGDGQRGQLGSATTTGLFSPARIPGLSGIVSIGEQTALDAAGRVIAWDATGMRPVSGLTGVSDLSGRYALRSNGTVARIDGHSAVSVTGLSGVVAINDQYALTSAGGVWRLPVGSSALAQVSGSSGITRLGTSGGIGLRADGSVWTWAGTSGFRRQSDLPPAVAATAGYSYLVVSR